MTFGRSVITPATTVPRPRSATAISEALGISYRQLDYWVRNVPGLVSASSPGSGHRRTFTDDEIVRLDMLARITKLSAYDSSLAALVVQSRTDVPLVVVHESDGVEVRITAEWRTREEIGC